MQRRGNPGRSAQPARDCSAVLAMTAKAELVRVLIMFTRDRSASGRARMSRPDIAPGGCWPRKRERRGRKFDADRLGLRLCRGGDDRHGDGDEMRGNRDEM